MEGITLSPSEFAGLLNQTLEIAYPLVTIEGELSNFRVSKNRWVYFDLQDEQASIKFFGTVYNLPGPLEDGMRLRVDGSPRLHPRFGFSVNVLSMAPAGEGSIKKAADLLAAKLQAEGLFDEARKRPLPQIPDVIGLVTAAHSAAYADFIKILNERWGGVEVHFIDVYVQGTQSPAQIVRAVEYFNRLPVLPDVLVITRGGGSIEDLASFSDERVVRAVAASRIPTLVSVGHEVDTSLAELAADLRASTPSNAAQLVVPHRNETIAGLAVARKSVQEVVEQRLELEQRSNRDSREYLTSQVNLLISDRLKWIDSTRKLLSALDPQAALRRGYAIVRQGSRVLSSVQGIKAGDRLSIQLADGTISAKADK